MITDLLSDLGLAKRRQLTSLLGLTLDGSRLEGVVLRRVNGSLTVQQTFGVALSLDPLMADAELVGQEIRNHLAATGVRERHCIVGLPLKWALTTHIDVPSLPEADVAGFLQIEAERGFPCDSTTLHVASSRCALGGGKQYALLAGIPNAHLTALEKALDAAKLKSVSFGLGIAALQGPKAANSNGVLALAIGETQVGLQITCGGGIAALRALEGTLDQEGGRRLLHADVVAREARITLGQLPAELREQVRRIRIFGPRDLAQQLADEAELRLEQMGVKVEVVAQYAPDQFSLSLPQGTAVSPALSLAAGQLAGEGAVLDFLPPRVTPWQQVTTRYSSGKLRLAGAVGGAALLLTTCLFGYQQWQLLRLQSQWNALAPRYKELQATQKEIRQFRPWYDESARGLTILKQLTLAFPESGVVSAKTVEIRDLNAVTCSGLATDYQALLKTLANLRTNRNISEVTLNTIRGKAPMQFTFNFHWNEGPE